MRQRFSDFQVFWREVRRSYPTTGALLPSGRALAAALTRYLREGHSNRILLPHERRGRRILEVGPGTGAVTARLVRDMRPGDQLDLVECNERFVVRLRERLAHFNHPADKHVTLLHSRVEDLPDDIRYDVVISGLPLNNFDAESVEQILSKLRNLLAPGGTLSFFEYVGMRPMKFVVSSQRERQRLKRIARIFRSHLGAHEICRDLVLANVPPAWVHHMRFDAAEAAPPPAPHAFCAP